MNIYQYDNLHRMTEVVQQKVTSPPRHEVAPKKVQFSYDAGGQWEKISRYEGAALDKLVAQSSFVFDEAGRLTDLTHAKGATTFADYGWTYDRANRVTQFNSSVDGTVDYVYDKRDQLTGADYTAQTDETYTYDDNGNRTNAGYSTGANNRLNSDGVYNYLYDNEGNRTRRTKISNNKVTDYTWDYRNRLTHITERNFPGGPATKTVEYVYDVWDRRIGKKIDANGNGSFEDESWYVYDGERSERGFAGDHIVLAFDENSNLTNRYLYGPAVDQIIADEQVTSLVQAGNVLWPLTDNLGTVRKLVDHNAATDTTTVANHITYDSFGNRTSETNGAVDHIFAFTGRQFDEEVGLHYYRARVYDSAVAQLLSEDPIYDDYNNPRRYAGNSSPNATDPSGLQDSRIIEAEQREANRKLRALTDPLRFRNWQEHSDNLENGSSAVSVDEIIWAQKWAMATSPRGIGEIRPTPGTPDFQAMLWTEECHYLDRMRRAGKMSLVDRILYGFNPASASPFSADSMAGYTGAFAGYGVVGPKAANPQTFARRPGGSIPSGRNRSVSGPSTPAYRENWERVFGNAAASAIAPLPGSYINSRFTIDMSGAPAGSAANAAGYARNGPWFWRQMLRQHPELFSPANAQAIRAGVSPRVDSTWVQRNPTHQSFLRDKLIHHHIDQGCMASPLPERIHHAWHSILHPN